MIRARIGDRQSQRWRKVVHVFQKCLILSTTVPSHSLSRARGDIGLPVLQYLSTNLSAIMRVPPLVHIQSTRTSTIPNISITCLNINPLHIRNSFFPPFEFLVLM